MTCSIPIYFLLERQPADGAMGLPMEPDLASALDDALADPGWRAVRIALGRAVVLEGADVDAALAERRAAA